MAKVDWQYEENDTVLLGINGKIPDTWIGKRVRIGDIVFDTLFVIDLPNHIAIKGSGGFVGKTIEFM